jgi:lipopolysaccharide transport system permease protein
LCLYKATAHYLLILDQSTHSLKYRVIEPKLPWWKHNWREIWDYRSLLYFLVRRDITSRFKQTILGPLHLFIRPFLMSILFQVIFSNIGGFTTDTVPPFLFYFANNIAWSFFACVFGANCSVFRGTKDLMNMVYYPKLINPISLTMVSVVDLCIQLLLLSLMQIVFLVIFGWYHISWSFFLLPIALIQLTLIGLGLGISAASLSIRYRDLDSFYSTGIRVLMYLTPVIFPYSQIPQEYKFLAALNPLSSAMELFRYSLFGQGYMSMDLHVMGWAVTIVMLSIGFILYSLKQRNYIDIV